MELAVAMGIQDDIQSLVLQLRSLMPTDRYGPLEGCNALYGGCWVDIIGQLDAGIWNEEERQKSVCP